MRPILLIAALPLALVACNQRDTPPPEPQDTAMPVEPDGGTGAGATPLPSATPTDTSGIPEGGIPTALQGRWGMVPADCTSTRGDAKGLLVVSATTLTFYESVGKLGTIQDRGESSIRADFSFSGEGMTWSREESLSRSGDTLARTEKGGDEPGSGGPFTYTRCAN